MSFRVIRLLWHKVVATSQKWVPAKVNNNPKRAKKLILLVSRADFDISLYSYGGELCT